MFKKLSIVLIVLPLCIKAQNIPQDFGVWSRFNAIYKVNKKINITSRAAIRTQNNSLTLNQNYYQLAAKYKFNKHFNTSFAYRLKNMNEEYGSIIKHRFHNDLTLKKKFDDISLYLRFRTQYQVSYVEDNEFYERIRFKTSYKINKKINTYISDEFYIDVNTPLYDKNRFTLGLEYKINKDFDIEIKYIRNLQLNVDNPDIMNVLGIGLSYDIN